MVILVIIIFSMLGRAFYTGGRLWGKKENFRRRNLFHALGKVAEGIGKVGCAMNNMSC
jgi:hypothetical protein